jgi:hypothetical protein
VGDQQGSLIEMITGKQGLSGTVPGFHTLSLLTQRAINSVFADSAQEKSFEKWDREEDKKCFNFNILQTKKAEASAKASFENEAKPRGPEAKIPKQRGLIKWGPLRGPNPQRTYTEFSTRGL